MFNNLVKSATKKMNRKQEKLDLTKGKINLLLSSWREVILQLGAKPPWKLGFIFPQRLGDGGVRYLP